MQKKIVKIFAPAKLNIFLRVLSKRKDGFHNIRTGITFINLFDVVEIKESDKLQISYKGKFKPFRETYDDCIIYKTLEFLKLNNNLNVEINVEKNIPVQGGLGSASTNAAALIQGLEKMHVIDKRNYRDYGALGADIPCFLFNNNCLVAGIGERIFPKKFPKYYFLIVKPSFNNSTKEMYQKLNLKYNSLEKVISTNENQINEHDTGNDFEKIVFNEHENFIEIYKFLNNLDNSIFSRMTGSGSCFYAVFEKKEHAILASKIFKLNYKNLWSCVAENNIINNHDI